MFRPLPKEPVRNLVLCDRDLNILGDKHISVEVLQANYSRLKRHLGEVFIARKPLSYNRGVAKEMHSMVEDEDRDDLQRKLFKDLLFLMAQSDIYHDVFQDFLDDPKSIISFDSTSQYAGYCRPNNDGKVLVAINHRRHIDQFDLASTLVHEIIHGVQPLLKDICDYDSHISHALFRSRALEAEARAVESLFSIEQSNNWKTVHGIPRYFDERQCYRNKKRLRDVFSSIEKLNNSLHYQSLTKDNLKYAALFSSAFLSAFNCREFMQSSAYDIRLIDALPINHDKTPIDVSAKMMKFQSLGFPIGRILLRAGVDFNSAKFSGLSSAAYSHLESKLECVGAVNPMFNRDALTFDQQNIGEEVICIARAIQRLDKPKSNAQSNICDVRRKSGLSLKH